MKVVLGCLALALTTAVTGLPAAASHSRVCVVDIESGGYRCHGTDEGHAQGGGNSTSTSPPTTVYPFQELWRAFLTQDADGNTCIDGGTVRLGREPTEAERRSAESQFLQLARSYPICPDAALPPATTPALEAASFLRQISLPVPRPYVQPDALPVGFEAYLETGAPTSQTYGPVDTPFGPLTLTATAQIYVDWDDPHDDVDGEHGPHMGQPGPHPTGEITHVYQHHGVYDIAVRYVWTARWAIGDITGTIAGVETSGSYPDPGFEAYSREAVGR